MPLLRPEIDLFPDDLLEMAANSTQFEGDYRRWWAIYTRSRHEKQLMRRLLAHEVPFYGPVIARRYRSANGRMRSSFEPLFANYVFLFGSDSERSQAITTNCVSRICAVIDSAQLTSDLRNVQRLIASGAPLTPEARVLPGERVRVRSGPFAGFEGQVLKRHGATRLLVYVEFMRQGASVLLEDCQLDVLQ